MIDSYRKVLHAKIHGATVTQADLNYEGSITVPKDLLDLAEIFENEAVHVWDITNGSRLETYTIKTTAGSGDFCINGAAARLVAVGDKVIIACFKLISSKDIKEHRPKIIFLDESNKVKRIELEKDFKNA